MSNNPIVDVPAIGQRVVVNGELVEQMQSLLESIELIINSGKVNEYTLAAVPDATKNTGSLIIITDHPDGYTTAVSNGVSWETLAGLTWLNGVLSVAGDIEATGTIYLPADSSAGIKFGDAATGTYGWNDITSEVKVRGVGGTDPSWSIISGGAFSAYKFSVGDKCWMSFHIPHDYAIGTDVYFHSHWFPDGTNTASVKWQFTYAYAQGHNQAAFPMASGTVITAEQTVGGTQYQHYITETVAVTLPNCEPDGILEMAIERVTNGGTDNTDGIFMLTADVHYQSTGLPTLNRAPDFYA